MNITAAWGNMMPALERERSDNQQEQLFGPAQHHIAGNRQSRIASANGAIAMPTLIV